MNLAERVKGLFLDPKVEWRAIDAEAQTLQQLYTGYVMILAAIPAIAGFVGQSLVGVGILGQTYRVPLESGLGFAVITYLFNLAWVFVMAHVIHFFGPKFDGHGEFIDAAKAAAFVPTPAWLGGVLSIIPSLAIVGFLVSLYSLYLLYLALPVLIEPPEEKEVPYFCVVVISLVVLSVVLYAVAALLIPSPVRGF